MSSKFDPANVFSPEAAKRYVGVPRNYRASEVFPGVHADSPRWSSAVLEARERIVALGVDEPAADGTFSGTGITADILKLGSIPGRPFTPSGVSATDNTDHIKGSSGRYAGLDEAFRTFVMLHTPGRGVQARAISLNKYSVSGSPGMSKDPDRKIANFLSWIERGEHRLKSIVSGSLKQLAKSDNVMNVWLDGYRYQPDKIFRGPNGEWTVKTRRVFAYAEQAFVDVDARAPEPWASWSPIHKACRARTIAIVNESAVGEKPYALEWKDAVRQRFPATYLNTTPEQILAKVAGWEIVIGDVEQHDNNMNMALLHTMYTYQADVVHPVWVALQLLHLRQPQLQKADTVKGKDMRVVGDPFDLTTFVGKGGNRSGNLSTTEVATVIGAWYIVHALTLAGELKPSQYDEFLKGANPNWRLLQQGDNFVLASRQGAARAWEILEAYPYATLGRSTTFLGYLFYKTRSGATTLVPSIASYPVNRFFPNRSISDPQKGDPLRGAPLVREHFSKAPSFAEVDEIFVDVLKRHLGIEYGRPFAGDPDPVALDRVQMLLAMNPDAPFYKLDLADIPQSEIDKLFILIPAVEAAKVINVFERQDPGPWRQLLDYLGRDLH